MKGAKMEQVEKEIFCNGRWWCFGDKGGLFWNDDGKRQYILTGLDESEKIELYILLSNKAKREQKKEFEL